MDSQLPMVFRIFQIVIPTFAVLVICTGLCRCYLQSRRRRHERRQLALSARSVESPSSVYIIPCSPPEEHRRGTPRYSQAQEYAPPPPYSEFVVKPDHPHEPPPSYTESVNHAFISSNLNLVAPTTPAPP